MFKPANHLHRYSRLSGADVTNELSKIREGNKCKKSDFVGIGYRDGKPISIGASAKGKIWSPAKVADLKEWKEWCAQIGSLITDSTINSDQILVDSAKKIQINKYPTDMKILAVDWAEELYERMYKITLKTKNHEYLLYETKLSFQKINETEVHLAIKTDNETIDFSIRLTGSENGFNVNNLDDTSLLISGFKKDDISLKKFFEDLPPTLFLLNSDTVSVIYAELSGDFPLGDSRQPTYKSLRPFDLVS